MKKRTFWLVCCTILLIAGCRKDPLLITDSSAKLSFSTDTVIFDTVFTQIGSATRNFKIYNPHGRTVKISNIQLAGGKNSAFRINIDGISADQQKDIELHGGDSLYIFAEVTIDPNNGTSPMIITDSILFETNGNLQDVDLVAWGQDAYFWVYEEFSAPDGFAVVLPNDKPNVFYGYSIVDSNSTMIIPAGTRLHFHKYSGLAVGYEATLNIEGTVDENVILEGDRLEHTYDDIPNQWGHPYFGGLFFTQQSKGGVIDYAVIKNGNIGLQIDSSYAQLEINNSIIQNMSGVGLLGQFANITATNCLFANAGQYVAALVFGGNYEFTHCTFANYWDFESRDNGLLLLSNHLDEQTNDLQKAQFGNCIIYGNKENELELSKKNAQFEYFFDHCLIKTDKSTTDQSHYNSIIKNPGTVVVDGADHDPVFNDPQESDYHLFSKSKAIDQGDPSITGNAGITEDLEGNPRDGKPDLGAFEL